MNICAHKTLRVAFSHRRKTGGNLLNLLLGHAIRFFKDFLITFTEGLLSLSIEIFLMKFYHVSGFSPTT